MAEADGPSGSLTFMCQSVCGETLPGVGTISFSFQSAHVYIWLALVRVCLLGGGISPAGADAV